MADGLTYIDFGYRSCYPGPFASHSGDMRMLLLKADPAKLEDLVTRVLNVPAAGAVEYRTFPGGHVTLVFGINAIGSTTPPWDERGRVDERLASFWIPLLAGHTRDGRFHVERFAAMIPFLLVDNAMSLVGGREIYGFPKAVGTFDVQDDGGVEISGYGGDWLADETARPHVVLSIEPSGGEAGKGQALPGVHGLIDGLLDRIGQFGDDVVMGDHVKRALTHMVFLKQFRSAGNQAEACYQRVIEAPVTLQGVRPRVSLRDWDVTIHEYDSHPILRELGLQQQQRATWSAMLEDFRYTVEAGVEI